MVQNYGILDQGISNFVSDQDLICASKMAPCHCLLQQGRTLFSQGRRDGEAGGQLVSSSPL